MERIYLDYAATTPLDERVLAAMMPYLTSEFGNPSSLHRFGQTARAAVQTARRQVATVLNVDAKDIVFTGGGTEADNLAVLGYLRASCPSGGHIVTTAVEHAAILQTFKALAEKGYDLTILPVGADGRVAPDSVRQALRDDTVLISVMAANNETGMIQPIEEIGTIAHEAGIVFHVDAVQGFGWFPLHPLARHIDLLSVAAHKIYGPKGCGALYIRRGLELQPDMYGGPQERHLRAGTENVAALVGFGKACELLAAEGEKRVRHAYALKALFYKELIAGSETYCLNGTLENSLPHIINFSIAHKDRAVVLIAADCKGLALSAGSACESGAAQPSHVLTAMGLGGEELYGSVRLSLGKDTTEADIRKAIEIIRTIAGEEPNHG
ncbi:cysteine desulfurase family protein [Colibacter massiliensis]|uniref:cysteine desulfurase family protein n=1 Tax=Colibacter massiliensis TaxID=1852379 RepID=UPI00266B9D36|nr:cysteine desulfurase family protein [Colibacter massiliensis]